MNSDVSAMDSQENSFQFGTPIALCRVLARILSTPGLFLFNFDTKSTSTVNKEGRIRSFLRYKPHVALFEVSDP